MTVGTLFAETISLSSLALNSPAKQRVIFFRCVFTDVQFFVFYFRVARDANSHAIRNVLLSHRSLYT